MIKNVGTVDRVVRGVGAVAALWGASMLGFGSIGGIVLVIVALVLGATAAVGTCPIYQLLGLNTCPVKRA